MQSFLGIQIKPYLKDFLSHLIKFDKVYIVLVILLAITGYDPYTIFMLSSAGIFLNVCCFGWAFYLSFVERTPKIAPKKSIHYSNYYVSEIQKTGFNNQNQRKINPILESINGRICCEMTLEVGETYCVICGRVAKRKWTIIKERYTSSLNTDQVNFLLAKLRDYQYCCQLSKRLYNSSCNICGKRISILNQTF